MKRLSRKDKRRLHYFLRPVGFCTPSLSSWDIWRLKNFDEYRTQKNWEEWKAIFRVHRDRIDDALKGIPKKNKLQWLRQIEEYLFFATNYNPTTIGFREHEEYLGWEPFADLLTYRKLKGDALYEEALILFRKYAYEMKTYPIRDTKRRGPQNEVELAYLEGFSNSIGIQRVEDVNQQLISVKEINVGLHNMELALRPDAERGKIVFDSAREGGIKRAKQIREKHNGFTLAEKRTELEKMLCEYMDKGQTKKRACELMARKDDVYWSAEYLRKNLNSPPR